MSEGKKYDTGKLRWDLLQYECVEDIVRILTFGAEKYGQRNWMGVEPFEDRYFAALMRHLVAYRNGEAIDPESGLSHLAHAGCNIMFLSWYEKNKVDGSKGQSNSEGI